MGRNVASAWLAAAALLLAGCYSHNLPVPDQRLPHVEAEVPTAQVFVDAEGTLFPNGGGPRGSGRSACGTSSTLLGEAERRPGLRALLAAERTRQLAAMRAFLSGKRRVFIFIHGFDNNQRDTELPYGMLAQRIAFEPGDAVILFHWDGFDGRMFGAAVHFWQAASTNSQMAGTRGLRPILDLVGPDQQAILISHSRGGTVTLQRALQPALLARLHRAHPAPALCAIRTAARSAAAAAGARNIHAVMMGPAMGRLDFVVADCPRGTGRTATAGAAAATMSAPSRASRSLDHTVNPCDEVARQIFRPVWDFQSRPISA